MTTVYVNGNIYTSDETNKKASAMAVNDSGKIIYVGDSEGASAFKADAAVDLAGQTVTPGFINGHSHIGVMVSTLSAKALRIPETATLEELRAFIDEHTSADPKPEYLALLGYNLTSLYGAYRHGKASDIDDVSHGVPVVMLASDGHSTWINTPAIELFGYKETVPESVRGSCEFDYICDEKGSRIGVTGYANEGATVLFFNEKLPYCRPENLEPLVAPVLDIYHKYGFTGVYEPGANRKLRKILAKLDAKGKIDMYYEASWIAVRESDTLKENIYRGKNFNMRTLKLFVDGTLALRTIALIEPYTDGSNYEPNLTEDELYEFMKDALANDCNIHVHAIGDRSQLEALRAFKRIQGIKPHLTRTIAHNRVNTYEALDLYESMKENTFYNSTPGWFVETPELRMYLGDKRADNNIFLMKQAIDRGVRCSIGEDFPASSIECLNPMLQLRYAVSRKAGDKIEDTPGVWLSFIGPDGSALTREDVLKCYTIWGAQQLTIDDKTGSLEAGKYADFVIWSDDFMDESKVPDSELERVTAKEVYFQGRKLV